jgi:uncharacterized protein (TIGR00106 family)
MATADLTVIALGRADASASRYIAEIQRRLAAQERVRYTMHAMGTSLEGATADILAVAGELHAVPFDIWASRTCTRSSSSTNAATASRRSRTRCPRCSGCSTRPDASYAAAAAAGRGAATVSSHASTSARPSSKPVRGRPAITACVRSRQ